MTVGFEQAVIKVEKEKEFAELKARLKRAFGPGATLKSSSNGGKQRHPRYATTRETLNKGWSSRWMKA